jgi:hypothetical protein
MWTAHGAEHFDAALNHFGSVLEVHLVPSSASMNATGATLGAIGMLVMGLKKPTSFSLTYDQRAELLSTVMT